MDNEDAQESPGRKTGCGGQAGAAADGDNPSKTPRERLVDAFGKGCSRKAAAAAGEMTSAELDRLLAEEPDVARAASMGRGKAEYELVGAIWESKDWRARAWLLEHWVGPGAQAEGEGLDDDGRERDDLSYRRLREDLAQSAGRPAVEEAAPERAAGGPGDVAGPPSQPPA